MSIKFLDALKNAGLTSGLSTFPIIVENEGENSYVGVFSSVDLGSPEAPYDYIEKCTGCKKSLANYSFYPTYKQPANSVHWMSTIPSSYIFVISRQVYKWLENEGRELSDKRPSTYYHDELWKFYEIAGWYPNEKDLAFFPEEFHEK